MITGKQIFVGAARFCMALFVAAALVGVTGFYGGALIYGLDHLAW